jgi:hypothetical protein
MAKSVASTMLILFILFRQRLCRMPIKSLTPQALNFLAKIMSCFKLYSILWRMHVLLPRIIFREICKTIKKF